MAEEFKKQGNDAFSAGKFDEAIGFFSQAIELDPSNHVLYSNRSACYSSKRLFEKAASDADRCVSLNPKWAKGYSRKGAALHGLEDFDGAIAAYEEGLKLEPGNAQCKKGIKEVKADAAGSSGGAGGDPMAGMASMLAGKNLVEVVMKSDKLRAQMHNPKVMEAMADIEKDSNNYAKYSKDPVIGPAIVNLVVCLMQSMNQGGGFPGGSPGGAAGGSPFAPSADGARPQSSPIAAQQLYVDYSALVAEPALAIIRDRLLQDRPPKVLDYITQHHIQIHSEIEASTLFRSIFPASFDSLLARFVAQKFDSDYIALVAEPALAVIRDRLLQDRPPKVLDYISQHHIQIHSEIEACIFCRKVFAIAFASGGGAAGASEGQSGSSAASTSTATDAAAAASPLSSTTAEAAVLISAPAPTAGSSADRFPVSTRPLATGVRSSTTKQHDKNRKMNDRKLIESAARGGSTDDVRLLVAAGADVDAVDEEGMSAMYWAAQQGHAEVLEALARAGADCNQGTKDGRTPLLISSCCHHLRCVEVLLKEGADVNKADNSSVTPLFIASQNGHCDVVEALLRGGAAVDKARNDGVTPLCIACCIGQCDVVNVLLRAGADVNKAMKIGSTPLFMASQNGHCDVVEALLRGGADGNKKNNEGSVALNVASEFGHCDIVKLLIRGGADVNHAANNSYTPLCVSSQNGHCDVVDALLRSGADVNKAINDGAVPLWIASGQGHCDVVEVLLRGGADVNKARNDGVTPLNWASENGRCDVIYALLRAGGDSNMADKHGITPLCRASFNGHSDAVEVLLLGGADVNMATNDGTTPLFLASKYSHCHVVKSLLRGGADMNKARNDGATPLFIASDLGNSSVVKDLVLARADLTLTCSGQTPLISATKRGHTDVIGILQSAEILMPESRLKDEQGFNRTTTEGLGRSNSITCVDASERDEQAKPPLIALAVRGGSADDVRLLVAAGADVDAVDEEGMSAMYWAAQQGHAEVLEALARAGADCNQGTKDGRTPLWISSCCHHLRCVEVLLKEGADVNKADNSSVTPLSMAIQNATQNGHCDVVEALLRGGADVNKVINFGRTPLSIACQIGHCFIVDALLRAGADVNKAMFNGSTPLLIASCFGHCDVVEALLRGGADANMVTNDGTTALYITSQQGHCDVVEALLRGGADANMATNDGNTPLYITSQQGQCDVVKALLRGGADANMARNCGSTPLFVAIIQGHCYVVDALLHGGANVNKADDRGVTPLFIASFKGLVDVVEALLLGSADVNIATNDGITPLWIASEQGYYDIVEALLRGGADVNIVSTDGTTPLYNASIEGYSNIVDTLLSGGADVNKANGRGITPLNAASFKGHCGVVELLLLARADLNSASDGLTPLLSATKNGHTDVINVLQLASAAEKVRSRMTESVQQSQTGAFNNGGGASVPYGDLSHSSAAICIDQSTAVAVANPLSVLTAEAAYARNMHFALRIISADFPRFELGKKVPNCHKSNYWVTIGNASKLRMDFDNFDYGISFQPFCSKEFLPSLSSEDHQRLMNTAAIRESFRCFFLHLAVELGVHPVALQHVCRERCLELSKLIADRTTADEDTEIQLFGESVNSVLERGCCNSGTGTMSNNFVDAQFLQAVWPQEMDNVRLLIITVVHGRISTHDWNLFTPKANAQATIDGGDLWAGRDVILKLENGHFTTLKALKSKSEAYREHPIQDLLDMIGEAKDTEAPGERQLLHLESIFGGEPDPTRPLTILQLFDSVASGSQSSFPFHQLPNHTDPAMRTSFFSNPTSSSAVRSAPPLACLSDPAVSFSIASCAASTMRFLLKSVPAFSPAPLPVFAVSPSRKHIVCLFSQTTDAAMCTSFFSNPTSSSAVRSAPPVACSSDPAAVICRPTASGGGVSFSIASCAASTMRFLLKSVPAFSPAPLPAFVMASRANHCSSFLLFASLPLFPALIAASAVSSASTVRGGAASISLSTTSGGCGKFSTFVHPCGQMEDFHKGLSSRIGFPHLEFEKTMEAEHTSMAGCDMEFTTRNYGIITSAKREWGVAVRSEAPPPEHMLHGRVMVSVEEKMQCSAARKAGLRREEVITIILYTGPMYMIYNCVLARWSNPAALWDTLRCGNNLFTTTLSVLVSAVQKLSAITVIPDGLKLYRGTGGLVYLPEHFSTPDEFNCRGMTEWGFMSCSEDKEVAVGYSGAAEGRPHAMVLEIEPSFVDRGAIVSEFSQYPHERETLFLPMSYVAQSGTQFVERNVTGKLTVIPVRVSVNLKAERLEQLEEKKKSIHLTGFEFRVNELRQRLLQMGKNDSDAEARLAKQKFLFGGHSSVERFVETQVKKVEAVMLRHRDLPAADYSNDDIYRRLVSESLEVARMAESAMVLLLRGNNTIHFIEDLPLRQCQRMLDCNLKEEWLSSGSQRVILKHQIMRRGTVVDLCRSRSLMRIDTSERDEYGETPLIALAAQGGSADDVRLLVAAGADVDAVDEEGMSAMYWAARQGHPEVLEALARAGADCNQGTKDGRTPLWISSCCHHLRCVEVLLKEGADVNKADNSSITPLFLASQNGHCDVVEALLRGGAAVDKALSEANNTIDGATPLSIACQSGHCDVVNVLLRAGADVNKAKSDGSTPIFSASLGTNDNPVIIDVLVRAKADINKATKDGVHNGATPLYIAVVFGLGQNCCNIVDALLRGRADPNKAMNDGQTPLCAAAAFGKCEAVKALVRARADVTLSCNGQSPLAVASRMGFHDIVTILKDAALNVAE